MSESEKKRLHFIQFSSDFLYDPKIQKLYMIGPEGKGLVMVYLQLLLIAARNGNFITLEDIVYDSLGEQLSPQILNTTSKEIDKVIEHFIKCCSIKKDGNEFEFLHAKEFTKSITRGAINKRNQRIAKKADIVGLVSDSKPTQLENVGNNNNKQNDIYIKNNIILLENFGVAEKVINELLTNYTSQQISEGINYAIEHIDNNTRNPAGYIVQCVRKNYSFVVNANKASPSTSKQEIIEVEASNADSEHEPLFSFDDALVFWNEFSEEQKTEFWGKIALNADVFSIALNKAYQKNADDFSNYNLAEKSAFANKLYSIKEDYYGKQC